MGRCSWPSSIPTPSRRLSPAARRYGAHPSRPPRVRSTTRRVSRAEMGGDAEFVRYLQGRPWTIDDAVGMISTCRTVEDSIGATLWALEDRDDGALVGYCGVGVTNATCVRTDRIEIGWGIERSRWG